MNDILHRDGLGLAFTDSATGRPILFQHGLGGDEAQVAEAFPPDVGLRRLTLECRGHGRSPLGDPGRLSIATFADDVLALADSGSLGQFAMGGISMGAAIALRLAVMAPERVSALILIRPAWVEAAAPDNMRAFALVADLLRDSDAGIAKQRFANSKLGQEIAANAPDNYASLLGFFDRPGPLATAALLRAIAADGPGVSIEQIGRIGVPTLVVGNRLDHVHPLVYATRLAGTIPGATFIEAAPKASDKALHFTQLRQAIGTFLAGTA